MEYTRNCPQCNKIIKYESFRKTRYEKAVSLNSVCNQCNRDKFCHKPKYPELYKQGKTKCTICLQIKDFSECVPESNPKRSSIGYRNCCIQCNRDKSNNYHNNKTQEEKELHKNECKKRYHHYRDPKNLSKLTLDEQIILWCKRSMVRKNTKKSKGAKLLQTRKNLTVEILKPLCYEALKKFPYMIFLYYKGSSCRLDLASLDRIDSSKDYTNIQNLRVIPLWLNLAKSNASDQELNKRIKQYIDIIK